MHLNLVVLHSSVMVKYSVIKFLKCYIDLIVNTLNFWLYFCFDSHYTVGTVLLSENQGKISINMEFYLGLQLLIKCTVLYYSITKFSLYTFSTVAK